MRTPASTELELWLEGEAQGYERISQYTRLRELEEQCVLDGKLDLPKLRGLVEVEAQRKYKTVKEFGKNKTVYICESPIIQEWQAYMRQPMVRSRPKVYKQDLSIGSKQPKARLDVE